MDTPDISEIEKPVQSAAQSRSSAQSRSNGERGTMESGISLWPASGNARRSGRREAGGFHTQGGGEASALLNKPVLQRRFVGQNIDIVV